METKDWVEGSDERFAHVPTLTSNQKMMVMVDCVPALTTNVCLKGQKTADWLMIS